MSELNSVISLRKTINKIKDRRISKKQDLVECTESLAIYKSELEDHISVRDIFKQSALLIQNYLETHLSNIVSKAIQAVFFEKKIKFKVKFVERRNTSECDMFLVDEDDDEFDLLDDRGHGIADIASMALLVAYVLLDNVDNVLVMDEPGRNLSLDRQPYMSKMIKELSRELNMQFIIVTHSKELAEYADKHLKTSIKNKVSTIS